jgi:hypothetical protein
MPMLPTHIPLKALESLIRDHSTLTASESEDYTPLEMLTGYFAGGEYGGMPFENPESDETDPMKRLQAGERLAIQLHLGTIQQECDFIDGTPYAATEAEILQDEDNMEEASAFPDETGFFSIGIWLDGERLGVEPVRISGDMNGNVGVGKAVFPESLVRRATAYLRRVGEATT